MTRTTIFLCIFIILTAFVFAYPTTEKVPATGVAPLDVLSSIPTGMFVSTAGDFQDRYIFTFSSKTLTIIDTRTWLEYPNSVEDFSQNIVAVDLLSNGTSLMVALDNGNVARLELDDEDTFENTEEEPSDDEEEEEEESGRPTDSRELFVAEDMTAAGISDMVTDPNDDLEKVYMINTSGLYYYEYNFTTNSLLEFSLNSENNTSLSASHTPNKILFAESEAGDRIVISTTTGVLLITEPGSGVFTEFSLTVREDDTVTPNLTQMALDPDQNYVYLLDVTNDLIWVFSLQSEGFENQISTAATLDPIEFDTDDNSSFTDLVLFEDTLDSTVTAYLAGTSGLSLVNAGDPGTPASTKNIDNDTSTPETDDPISLSGTPNLVRTSSASDRYVYTANGDASISVITDKPFVSVTSLSTTSVNITDSTFTTTFQTDTAGAYSVHSNSNPDGTGGTELIASTSIADINTDTTTSTIDINSLARSAFVEGSNAIVVYVTATTGALVGRGGIYLTVDRPPEALTISTGSFGNAKAFLDFEPSEDDDIANYILYAEPAENQTSPTCPGSLTFASTSVITVSLSPSLCSSTLCSGTVTGLTNGTYYCLAVRAVDNSSQNGDLSALPVAILPELTVGPAEFSGETGCQLFVEKEKTTKQILVTLLLFVFPLTLTRALRKRCHEGMFCAMRPKDRSFKPSRKIGEGILFCFFILAFFSSPAFSETDHARFEKEVTPKFFTFEFRVSSWIPMDSDTKTFFSVCCNPTTDLEVGILFKDRYNLALSTGFAYFRGDAIGITTGRTSGERFNLLTVPLRLSFIYRFDFVPEQMFVPFARLGVDSVIFNEFGANNDIWGNKFGFHAGAGLAILLDRVESLSADVETDMGINDIFLILEGRYAYINSFQDTGLDLSGIYPYLGVLFAF